MPPKTPSVRKTHKSERAKGGSRVVKVTLMGVVGTLGDPLEKVTPVEDGGSIPPWTKLSVQFNDESSMRVLATTHQSFHITALCIAF